MRIARKNIELSHGIAKRGFVPTMGALHEGHLSLVHLAKQNYEEVVVSVFVNPTQFGKNEDLDRYPRQEALDRELCEKAGVDIFFAPTVEEMYPYGLDASKIHIGEVGDLWEGALRPGHFDGVATVVAKLAHIVSPAALIMGQKDLQQCAIVDRMIKTLNEPYELVIGPTLRESDGLAMSSRNAYLSAEERRVAPQIYGALSRAKAELLAGMPVIDVTREAKARLSENFDVQYFALVNKGTLAENTIPDKDSALIVAAYLGKARLIDNLLLD